MEKTDWTKRQQGIIAFIDGLKLSGKSPEDWECYLFNEFGMTSEDAQSYLEIWAKQNQDFINRLNAARAKGGK